MMSAYLSEHLIICSIYILYTLYLYIYRVLVKGQIANDTI